MTISREQIEWANQKLKEGLWDKKDYEEFMKEISNPTFDYGGW